MNKIVIGILSVLIVFVLLECFYFVINWKAVVEVIFDCIASAIKDNLKGGLLKIYEWVTRRMGDAEAIIAGIQGKEYDGPSSEMIEVIIPDEYIRNVKAQIQAKADLKSAGLDDIQLKKMILTSFKTTATNYTELKMLITKEEYDCLPDSEENETFYRAKAKRDDGIEDYYYYIVTKGIVRLQVETTNDDGDTVFEDMRCYNQETLTEINNRYEYLGRPKNVKEFLEKVYTVNTIGSIKMMVESEVMTYNVNSGIYSSKNIEDDYFKYSGIINYAKEDSEDTLSETILQYSDQITDYIMPLEFLSTILEMTSSPEFVLKVCDLVANSEITAVIYKDNVKEINASELQSESNIRIESENGRLVAGTSSKGYKQTNSEITLASYKVNIKRNYSIIVTSADTWWCKVTTEVNKKVREAFMGSNLSGTTVDSKDKINEIIDYMGDSHYGGEFTFADGITWNNTYNVKDKSYTISDDEQYYLSGIFDFDINKYNIDVNNSSEDMNDDSFQWDFINKILQTEYNRVKKRYYRYTFGTSGVVDLNDVIKKFSILRKNEKSLQYSTTITTEHSKGVSEKTDKTDNFLNLLRDSTTGEDVAYSDIYGSNEALVGKLLENGDQMMFQILESFETSKDTADIMRYILYRYSGQDYGITDINDILLTSFNSVGGYYGSSVQEKLWFALKDLGYGDILVASIMGNIQSESGTDPTKIELGYNENNGGIGICQWTNGNRGTVGRNTNLKKYAESKGLDWTDENTQIEFLITELTGSGSASSYANFGFSNRTNYYSDNLACYDSWSNANSIEDATRAFCYSFEGPSKEAAKKSMSTRIDNAKKIYEQFQGMTKPTGGTTQAATGDGYSQTFTSATGRTYKEYKQWQGSYKGLGYADGTIADSGCSITAVAIVISGYGSQKTPANFSGKLAVLAGSLTEGGARCYGYEVANKERLTSGNPAVVSIKGKLVTENGSKYYSGHYIAILGARNGNEVYVSDPGADDSKCGGWTDVNNIINIVNKGVLYVENY